MAVRRQRFEMFRFPVMQSTFRFPNIAFITIQAASLINYFRPKGKAESDLLGEKGLNSASVSSAITDHMTQTGHRIKWDHFDILVTGQSDIHCKIVV